MMDDDCEAHCTGIQYAIKCEMANCDRQYCICKAKWHCEHGDLRLLFLVRSALAMPNCDGQCCNCKAKWRCERGNNLRQDGHHVVVVVFRWGRAAGDSISSVLVFCKWCCFVLLRVLSCQMHGCHSGVCRNMRVLVAASHLDLTHVVDLHFGHMGLASW